MSRTFKLFTFFCFFFIPFYLHLHGASVTDKCIVYSDPANPPAITSLSLASGVPGTELLITGTDLSNTSAVMFGAVPAKFSVNAEGTQITTWVPASASVGKIRVTTSNGSVLSENFLVKRLLSSYSYEIKNQNFSSIAVGSRSRPAIADLDGDGLLDLLVGSLGGPIQHYVQTASNSSTFNLVTNSFNGISLSFSAPAITDLNGDGLLDLLVGKRGVPNGSIYHYVQTAPNALTFSLLTDKFAGIEASDCTPSFSDLDNDGLLDLVIGIYDGALHYKQSAANSLNFDLVPGTFDMLNGNGIATLIADLDGDGALDLLSGVSSNKFDHFEKNANGEFKFVNNGIYLIDMLKFTLAPLITDLDGNGLVDMLVGNHSGSILHLEQLLSPPAIVSISDDTGSSSSDKNTSDNSLILRGTTIAGSSVTLYTKDTAGDPVLLGSAVAQGTTWSYDHTAVTLPEGKTIFTAVAELNGVKSASTSDFTVNVDKTVPSLLSIKRQDPLSKLTSQNTLTFRVSFSEAVARTDAADFKLSATTASISSVTSKGSGVFDVVVSGGDLDQLNGSVALSLASTQNIIDVAGNGLMELSPSGDNESYMLDNKAPLITLKAPEGPTSVSPLLLNINFSEEVTGFDADDIVVNNGTKSGFSGSGKDYSVYITPSGSATIAFSVAAGAAVDLAGNENAVADPVSVDFIAPATLSHAGNTVEYPTIQSAIDAAVDGDKVSIIAGTFTGQLLITKGITLEGAGKDKTIIRSPLSADLVQTANWKNLKGQDVFAVIGVKSPSAPVILENLAVDGADQGYLSDDRYADKMAYTFQGIGIYNTTASVDNVKVTRVRELYTDYASSDILPAGYPADQPSGMNHNESVFSESAAGEAQHTLTLSNSYIDKYQKTAIMAWGPTQEVNIHGNTVQGYGKTLWSTGNAIQIASSNLASGDRRGTKGKISDNKIFDIGIVVPEPGQPGSYLNLGLGGSTGILLWEAGEGFEITGNTITGSNIASWHNDITSYDGGYANQAISITNSSAVSLSENSISKFDAGIIEEGESATMLTLSKNIFSGNGIDVIGASGNDKIELREGAEVIGLRKKDTGVDELSGFGAGDKIYVFDTPDGTVNGLLNGNHVINFNGTISAGDGSSVAAYSAQLSSRSSSATLFVDTDGIEDAAELQITLKGSYVHGNFKFDGPYIKYQKASQVITFAETRTVTYRDDDFDPAAKSDAQLDISYKSSDENIAKIVEGKIQILAAGEVTITASQEGNGSFEAADPKQQVLTISKKDITVELKKSPAISKVYDGLNSASLAAENYKLIGLKSGDMISVSGTASYADKTAGTDKEITVTDFVLEGAGKENYNLTTVSATTSGAVTKKSISLALKATPEISKTYDAGKIATLVADNYSISGLEDEDKVTVSGSAEYDTKNVGTEKIITVTNFLLDGEDKDNYELTTTSAETKGAIVKKDMALSLKASPAISKSYDGSKAVSLPAESYTFIGLEDNDVVTVTSTAVFEDKNAGSNLAISAESFVLDGIDSGNYNLITTTAETSGSIIPKDISLALSANPLITKPYDGNTTATLVADNYKLQGVENGDELTVSGTAVFDKKDAGVDKTVSVESFVLSGADKDNYKLSTLSATTTGSVSPKDITVVLNDLPIITKVYDSKNTVTLAAENYSLQGLEGTDKVTVTGTASFDTKHAGVNKTVTAASFVLAGADKDNYHLTTGSATTQGKITAKDISLSLNSLPAVSKEYDGSTIISLAAGNYNLSGLESGDQVSVSGTANFDTKDAGTGKEVTASGFVLAGSDQGNYHLSTLSSKTSGTVRKKTLTVTADDKNKFQNTPNPSLTVSYSGFVTGESKANLLTEATATTSASQSSALGKYDIVPAGAQALNYTFDYVKGVLTIVPGHPTSITFNQAAFYENGAAGTVAGSLSSTSDDPAATFTYSLVSGPSSNDNALFRINGNELSNLIALDFESKPNYLIRVRSTTQHGLSLDRDFVVKLSDVNEVPTLNAVADVTLCYTPAQQSISLSGITAGPDAGQNTTLSVSSSNNSLFEDLAVTQAFGENANLRYKFAPGASGTATVTVLVRDNGGTSNGGVDFTTRSFSVTVNALPVLSIKSDRGTSLSKGEVALLTASGGTSYQWASAGGILEGQNTPTLKVRPEETTTYTVTATNAANCSTSQSITIEVTADFQVVDGTNLITPNGDNVNDNFVIRNIDMYPNNEVKIFDRAGRLLYSKKNYNSEWNGTFNGAPLAEDTYYYIVDFGPKKPALKGFITIVRD